MSSKMMKIVMDIVLKSEPNGRYVMSVNARTPTPGRMLLVTQDEEKQLQHKLSECKQQKGLPPRQEKQLQLPLAGNRGDFSNVSTAVTAAAAPNDPKGSGLETKTIPKPEPEPKPKPTGNASNDGTLKTH